MRQAAALIDASAIYSGIKCMLSRCALLRVNLPCILLLNDTYMRVMYANAHRYFQNKTDLDPYHIKRQYQDSGRFEELKLTIFDTFSQRWVHPTALF